MRSTPQAEGGYVAIGLYHPKIMRNVGGVLRAAFCFDAALVAIAGTRYKKQPTDTPKTFRHIPLLQVDDLYEVIPYDCVPVAVELHPKAESIVEYSHPERAFYIFGPEDSSLGHRVLDWCRDAIYIPTRHSLNLAATVNVVLYDRLMKRGESHELP
jgi:tRNA(Leu) C34 or U34 (ribose-2'-O)-methylase TrmL